MDDNPRTQKIKSTHCFLFQATIAGKETEEGASETIVADYNKKTAQVYTDCAKHLLENGEGLALLSLVGSGNPVVQALPSWVPDFSVPLRPQPLRSCGAPISGAISSAASQIFFDGRELNTIAAQWDTISITSANINEMFGVDGYTGEIFNMVTDLGTTYTPTNEEMMLAVSRLMIGDITKDPEPSSDAFTTAWTHCTVLLVLFISQLMKSMEIFTRDSSPRLKLRDSFEKFIDMYNCPSYPFRDVYEEYKKSEPQKYFNMGSNPVFRQSVWYAAACFTVASDRRLLVTKKGYLGLGPCNMKVDDVVFLIPGADAPMILRPEKDKWRLVGEAYIHGVMQGEVKDIEPTPIMII